MSRLRAVIRSRIDRDDDRGITLVELLVAIMLLAIILTLASGFMVGAMRTVALAQTTSQGSNLSSNLMNELTRVIRSADDNPNAGALAPTPAFVPTASPTAESLTLFSNVDAYDGSASFQTRPVMVQFLLDPTTRNLIEKRWLPNSTTGGIFAFPAVTATPNSVRNLGGPILAASTTPATTSALFTYTDFKGVQLTPPISDTQLANIAQVTITVRVRGGNSAKGAVTVLQNTVQLVNLGFTTTGP